jgi:hypothetical protein
VLARQRALTTRGDPLAAELEESSVNIRAAIAIDAIIHAIGVGNLVPSLTHCPFVARAPHR